MPTDFDVQIGTTKAKIRKTENGGYTRRTIRREIENNLLSQSENPALQSRGDRPALYQTSWAGGSRWWKPLITPQDLTSYFRSNHIDAWSEPGRLVPMNKETSATATGIHGNCVIGVSADGSVYAIGSTNTTDSTNLDVYKWTPASNAFVRETTYMSGVDDAAAPVAMAFDPSDGYFYVLASDGDIGRFKPTATVADDADYITGLTFYAGANIFLQNSNLLFYNGDQIYTIDKTGPSATSRVNDGMGPDFLNGASFATGSIFKKNINLAIATPEGIYYVKNTNQAGQPVAWVFRVERDAAGNWMLHPLATLPPGNVALGITYHLGQVVISASPDWSVVMANAASTFPEIDIYYLGAGGAGVLGSPLGNRNADETPHNFLGSVGPYLYIGGQKRLWVYDGIRGGLHTAFEWATAATKGGYRAMAQVADSDGDRAFGFIGEGASATVFGRVHMGLADDPDTVTNFGDDETHYTLTSNFFDGGLPMEEKELTKVAILREAGDGDQEWTVQISADGGAFADALVHSTTGETYAEADLSGVRGRKFQYRVIYQTKDTKRTPLEALMVGFTTGEQITEWDLMLDGTEMLNIDNTVQDEEEFYDAMKALAAQGAIIDFVDNMQEQGRESGDGAAVEVKVMAVEIVKSKPGESTVRVVLREA